MLRRGEVRRDDPRALPALASEVARFASERTARHVVAHLERLNDRLALALRDAVVEAAPGADRPRVEAACAAWLGSDAVPLHELPKDQAGALVLAASSLAGRRDGLPLEAPALEAAYQGAFARAQTAALGDAGVELQLCAETLGRLGVRRPELLAALDRAARLDRDDERAEVAVWALTRLEPREPLVARLARILLVRSVQTLNDERQPAR